MVTWGETDLEVFLPKSIITSVSPDLAQFGDEVLSKRIFDWVTDAERNVPYLKGGGRDAFGRRTSELVVSEGWKNLQNFGVENGYAMPHHAIQSPDAEQLHKIELLQVGMSESIRNLPGSSRF
jgi:hypothetical protein